MLYSKQLLHRFISGDVAIEDLAKTLTLQVCEVEETHHRVVPDLVVLGKVIATEKHPDADKLTVCQIDCGTKGVYQICTAAENIRDAIYVPVALPGCFLPAINLQIEPRTMRGLQSNGMICSKNELGIGEDTELHGIWILQDCSGNKKQGNRLDDGDFNDLDDKKLGVALSDLFPRIENRVLEVENKTITHRPDLFGHFGLAWEYQALFSNHIRFSRLPQLENYYSIASLLYTLSQAKQTDRPVSIQSDAVGAYHILELEQVLVQESSIALRLQLLDLGITPKNNRVDFGNYFMFLTGQPIHCFDADKITGTLTVRQARAGELFVDLFDKEHSLREDDLVIADDEKILALAGIIGGSTSGITATTTKIVIEIAQFDPVMIRKTAMRIGLRTEAQTRFEKNIAPLATTMALLLCMDELQYFGEALLGNWTLVGIQNYLHDTVASQHARSIGYDKDYVRRIMGTEISDEAMLSLLQGLGFRTNPGGDQLLVPLRRGPDDMLGIADVAEEVARIYGYDRIGTASYTTTMQAVSRSNRICLHRQVEDYCSKTLGYTQMETYPWIHQRWHESFGISAENCLMMENSLAPELHALRNSMIPSMLEIIEKNAPFYDSLKIYDIGKSRTLHPEKQEHDMLAIALLLENHSDRKQSAWLQLKGQVSALLTQLTIKNYRFVVSSIEQGHSIQQATVMIEESILGVIFVVHPKIQSLLGIDDNKTIVVAELDMQILERYTTNKPITTAYQTLQDQIVTRDLSFVIKKTDSYGTIVDVIRGLETVQAVEIIDIYTGPQLAHDEKSISLRFQIQGDGTLTTEQINAIMQQAIIAAEEKGATLRG